MKNWKTTVLGLVGAFVLLATSKEWIDQDVAAFIGATLTAIFGLVSSDGLGSKKEIVASEKDVDGLIGTRPNDR